MYIMHVMDIFLRFRDFRKGLRNLRGRDIVMPSTTMAIICFLCGVEVGMEGGGGGGVLSIGP